MSLERAPARVLVVDDEPVIIELVTRALRRFCVIESAPDGAEALARLSSDRDFALVLSDLSMPRLNGLALLDALRLAVPGLDGKFVIMTGGAQNRSDEEKLAVAGVPVLLKPFNVRELSALVKPYLVDEHGQPTPAPPAPPTQAFAPRVAAAGGGRPMRAGRATEPPP